MLSRPEDSSREFSYDSFVPVSARSAQDVWRGKGMEHISLLPPRAKVLSRDEVTDRAVSCGKARVEQKQIRVGGKEEGAGETERSKRDRGEQKDTQKELNKHVTFSGADVQY